MRIEVHQDRVKIKKANSVAANINLMVQLEEKTGDCQVLHSEIGKKTYLLWSWKRWVTPTQSVPHFH
jgi:hypothetical protein